MVGDANLISLATRSGSDGASETVLIMADPPEAHRQIEYHLRQAFLRAESETTKFHVRKVASLLEEDEGFERLLE
ncbi:hypothetical protein SAMN04487948_11277 [Halogranum amylolyticum]|uniref:Uncharacterized protein n=1 Tax=Halogranum amylolyticum TaxID=660520 RepID=A0A1H8US47_9EURY|nr:hypothetical protein SAMN04487948_11277 [Halogranum amylolyticum]